MDNKELSAALEIAYHDALKQEAYHDDQKEKPPLSGRTPGQHIAYHDKRAEQANHAAHYLYHRIRGINPNWTG